MKRRTAIAMAWLLAVAAPANAQSQPAEQGTRAGAIADQQREKAKDLKVYEPNKAEIWVRQLEELLTGGTMRWHPFFDSAYRGGGFTLGGGYLQPIGDYNSLDVRGSATIAGYLRFESEYRAPRLFNRRGTLSVIGGWRKATQVGYYGLGTANTSIDDQASYEFTQPYGSATLDFRPARNWFVLTGGAEYSEWQTGNGAGRHPDIDQVYTPETAPGLGASPTYLHLFGAITADTRASAGYARRGSYLTVGFHDYADNDDLYGFQRIDSEVIQHVPLGRDAWVLSLRARVETTTTSGGEIVPYFMMPSLGGGSDLRGFNSWRFRDLHSMLLQAEWRVLVNAFFETAIFFDAGKVTARRSDLDFNGLKSDYGVGIRFHGPAATPLRVDIAKSNESLRFVFAASAVF